MSTKSHARARRRHPELAHEQQALQAIGESILTTVTLGMLEPDTEVRSPDSKSAPAASTRAHA